MQVVKVGVSHQDQVDQRHEFKAEAGSPLSFDNTVPVCPIGVDDDGVIGELDEERGVPDPGDAYFSCLGGLRNGLLTGAVTFLKNLWQQTMAEEVVIPARPALLGQYAGIGLPGFRRIGFWWVGALRGHD